MKSPFYLLVVLPAFLLLNASCSKTDTILPTDVDSVISVLPKLVIVNDPSESYSAVFSIKYDTAHLKIEAYSDDTTNTNPYDVLALVHTFNDSGYLVSVNDIGGGTTTNIHRAPDNKIIWIRTNTPVDASLDTTFYQYQQSNGNTIITTVTNFYVSGSLEYTQSQTTTYNSNLKPVHITDSYGDDQALTYNANGSIGKVVYAGASAGTQEDYFYTSGIPDGTADKALAVFMGRDYYIQGLRDLYPLMIFYTSLSVSGTDPYHTSRVLYTDNGGTTEDRMYQYNLNANKLVSKITATTSGVASPATYEFRY